MSFATSPEFRKHSANVAEIRRSLKQIERIHRATLRSAGKAVLDPLADVAEATACRRMHHLLIGVLAEATLRKISPIRRADSPNGTAKCSST